MREPTFYELMLMWSMGVVTSETVQEHIYGFTIVPTHEILSGVTVNEKTNTM